MHKITSSMKESFLSCEQRWFLLAVCIFLQLKASDEEHTHLVGTSEEVVRHSTARNSSFLMLRKVMDISKINSDQCTVLHLQELLCVMYFKYM